MEEKHKRLWGGVSIGMGFAVVGTLTDLLSDGVVFVRWLIDQLIGLGGGFALTGITLSETPLSVYGGIVVFLIGLLILVHER